MTLDAYDDNYNKMWFKEGRFLMNIHGREFRIFIELKNDENESKYTYTQFPTTNEILTMSSDTNLNLDFKELSHCIKFSFLYFCQQWYLMKHTTEHTCESAIYHNQSPNVIKKCDIQYYPQLAQNQQFWMQVIIYY